MDWGNPLCIKDMGIKITKSPKIGPHMVAHTRKAVNPNIIPAFFGLTLIITRSSPIFCDIIPDTVSELLEECLYYYGSGTSTSTSLDTNKRGTVRAYTVSTGSNVSRSCLA